jgi:hypothetical protein
VASSPTSHFAYCPFGGSVYQELGLNLIYQRLDGPEKVRASLGVEFWKNNLAL